MNNFNFIAPFYDRLASLVFGKALDQASSFFLDEIKKDDNVLILGGGTGKILNDFPICKGVTYLEKSSKMLERATRRNLNQEVEFINNNFFEWKASNRFTIVISPFFLDCFDSRNLREAICLMKDCLMPSGKLIVTDFQPHRQWLLIRLMHLFFRVAASLESKNLKDIHNFVTLEEFQLDREEFFRKGMVFSRVYRTCVS